MSDIHRPEKKIALTIRLRESQIRKLRRLARADDLSLSAIARQLIDYGLDDVGADDA